MYHLVNVELNIDKWKLLCCEVMPWGKARAAALYRFTPGGQETLLK